MDSYLTAEKVKLYFINKNLNHIYLTVEKIRQNPVGSNTANFTKKTDIFRFFADNADSSTINSRRK
ncbi:hypothetical protein SJI19_08495 [Acerihabitans sp. TG2]|uniref:hypothetical protein n=1 Tax=Acerihabitans sp. TG2 TaxID=3096008 RepID=UPI002B23D9FA|nr:hypothetical protein [Acerihabitans sp. TG2]MEA9390579.1 hypothetical protein [Acerihabitans sp. TG2]